MVDTHSMPAPAPAQDPISRDSTQIDAQDQDVRRLTVSYGARSIRGPDGRSAPAPMLRLQGAWLERAGFAVGVPVTVRVRAGRLVIDVADPEGADVADPEGAPQTEAFARIARVTDGRVSRRELDALVRRLKRDRID